MLDTKSVVADCGRFSDADLNTIWSSPEYTDMQGELLALMQEFEVCYEIVGRKGHYIAPHLLELNPPKYNPEADWDTKNNLIVTYRYVFKPKNIFPRLIVALHELIENQTVVWKHGVVLTSKTAIGNTRAEITEDDTYKNASIRIRISGTDKKRMLSVIGYELDRINNTFDTLERAILIPCNCSECEGSQAPDEFPYATLQKSLAKQNDTIQCRQSFEQISVRRLIEDVSEQPPVAKQYPPVQPNTASPFSAIYIGGDVHGSQVFTGSGNPVTETNQHGTGDNIAGDKVMRDKIRTQSNSQSDLANLSQTLNTLIEDLSEEYNPTTPRGQANIQRDALETIRQDPTLQQRLANALKAGSEEALERMIQHSLAKITVKAIKGLIEG